MSLFNKITTFASSSTKNLLIVIAAVAAGALGTGAVVSAVVNNNKQPSEDGKSQSATDSKPQDSSSTDDAQSVEDADETTDGVSWFNQNRHLDQVISDPQGKIESMNDKKPRRHFDPAVKLQMIEMVRNQGLSVAQVCSEMKLSRSVLSRWLNQFDQEQAGRPGKGIPLTAEQRRICELEMQVRQLQSDNALLKKASAFFARELQ